AAHAARETSRAARAPPDAPRGSSLPPMEQTAAPRSKSRGYNPSSDRRHSGKVASRIEQIETCVHPWTFCLKAKSLGLPLCPSGGSRGSKRTIQSEKNV
ncbi:unnamed protein product, partial [Durusdinium trenchii]